MLFTREIILKIAPQANHLFLDNLVMAFNTHLDAYHINTLDRLDYFFGQAAEESDGFKTLTEYASGHEYEGRSDLGNIEQGDGARFKGRGIFQLTGRANYEHFGENLGLDLIGNPGLAATADVAVVVACEYWNTHNLSALADADTDPNNWASLVTITRKVNGGTNGLEDRRTYTDRADDAFSPLFDARPVPTPVVAPVVAPKAAPVVAPVVVAVEPVKAPVESPVAPTVVVAPAPSAPSVVTTIVDGIEDAITKIA